MLKQCSRWAINDVAVLSASEARQHAKQAVNNTDVTMTMLTKRIALLAANPAFGAIVGSGLQSEARLKVYGFQTLEAITTFLRISPIDLVILDAEGLPADLAGTIAALRRKPKRVQPDLAFMLLTRAAPAFHDGLLAQGIDVVHAKPVSPTRLLDSVKALVHLRAAGPMIDGIYRGPERRRSPGVTRETSPNARRDNVVHLFGPASKTA
jgi:DNA-binding response OmpR family regulator